MKPILFNTEMVKAILDGRKSVTRRKIKPQLMEFQNDKTEPWDSINHYRDNIFEFKCRNFTSFYPSPYQVGDILYVRETWQDGSFLEDDKGNTVKHIYKADDTKDENSYSAWGIKWKPSIHMPKEAARIFLRVKEVRAERLQDMCVADCVREGADTGVAWTVEAKPNFIKLWDSTVKKPDFERYGWNANPWVWVMDFERISKEEALSR